jgi:hypothetical protein
MFYTSFVNRDIAAQIAADLKELQVVRTLPHRLSSTFFSALYMPAVVYSDERVRIGSAHVTIEDSALGRFRIRCTTASRLSKEQRLRQKCFSFTLDHKGFIRFTFAENTRDLVQRLGALGTNEMVGKIVDEDAIDSIISKAMQLRLLQKKLTSEHKSFDSFCDDFHDKVYVQELPKFTLSRFHQEFYASDCKQWPRGFGKIHFVVQNNITSLSRNKFVLDASFRGDKVSIEFTSNEVILLRTKKLLATFIYDTESDVKCKLLLREYEGPTPTDSKNMKIGSLYDFKGDC